LGILARRSYQESDAARFRLSSGRWSRFYIDCRATTMCSEAIPLVGEVVATRVPEKVGAVGGLTMGADPIAIAVAYYCGTRGRRVDAFSVRKERKAHGLGRWIEGCVEPGAIVAVVDDVVTTGASSIAAIELCRTSGLNHVAAVVVLVDREEEGGWEAVQRAAGPGVALHRIFTREEIASRWRAEREQA